MGVIGEIFLVGEVEKSMRQLFSFRVLSKPVQKTQFEKCYLKINKSKYTLYNC